MTNPYAEALNLNNLCTGQMETHCHHSQIAPDLTGASYDKVILGPKRQFLHFHHKTIQSYHYQSLIFSQKSLI